MIIILYDGALHLIVNTPSNVIYPAHPLHPLFLLSFVIVVTSCALDADYLIIRYNKFTKQSLHIMMNPLFSLLFVQLSRNGSRNARTTLKQPIGFQRIQKNVPNANQPSRKMAVVII